MAGTDGLGNRRPRNRVPPGGHGALDARALARAARGPAPDPRPAVSDGARLRVRPLARRFDAGLRRSHRRRPNAAVDGPTPERGRCLGAGRHGRRARSVLLAGRDLDWFLRRLRPPWRVGPDPVSLDAQESADSWGRGRDAGRQRPGAARKLGRRRPHRARCSGRPAARACRRRDPGGTATGRRSARSDRLLGAPCAARLACAAVRRALDRRQFATESRVAGRCRTPRRGVRRGGSDLHADRPPAAPAVDPAGSRTARVPVPRRCWRRRSTPNASS